MNKNVDILFEVDPQIRERLTVWRLFDSPHINALCNDWWKYFAVGIPLKLAGANHEGDIDFLVCRPSIKFPEREMDFDVPQYRVFEVKVSTSDLRGIPKSLKHGKLRRLQGQMQKLKAFGCPLLYHFEVHILETGFSDMNNYPTQGMRESVELKHEFFQSDNYGYIVTALEFTKSLSEDRAGIWHPLINITTPNKYASLEPFNVLSTQLDLFYKIHKNELHEKSFQGKPVISYCYACSSLIVPTHQRSCSKCGKSLLIV